MPFRRAPSCATGPLGKKAMLTREGRRRQLPRSPGPKPRRSGRRETSRFARNLVPGTRERGHQRRPGRDQRQPVGQLARRIFRGRAEERHQRGRHPWQARDLRPPARGRHRQHLDDVVASGNAVLEALSVHRFDLGVTGVAIVVIQPARSSEATHEGHAQNHSGEKLP